MRRDVQQFDAAIARCEAVAGEHGHTLGKWYLVDERLQASMCEECAEMGWVSQSRLEEG